MHIGLFTIHPVTVPISPELVNAIVNAVNQSILYYSGVIRPELSQLKEIIELL